MSDPDQLKKQYDAAVKKVLAEKEILARILKACVPEYRDSSYEDITHLYLTDTPAIGRIPVEPDQPSRVPLAQAEDKTETEGTVFYDIRFTAKAPSGDGLIELIINIEAQNDFNPGYPLLKRAIYYCSRMISSQYGTVFVKSHYEKIQKVYSIWICTSPTKKWAYTISNYSLTESNIIGKAHADKKDYDLMTTVLVCLGEKPYSELTGLFRMLNLVLLDKLDAKQTNDTLANEFQIHITPHLEKGVADMCNLSAGIERRGIAKGVIKGKAEGREETQKETALRLIHMGGFSLDMIATISGLSVEQVKELMKKKE